MTRRLRLTGGQVRRLHAHLFKDDNEAVAIALCGQRRGVGHQLMVHKLVLIPHEDCDIRTPTTVAWSTDLIIPHLIEANLRGWSVIKFHSHPGGYNAFSEQDDRSDAPLFPSIAGWIDHEVSHASVVMLPDGAMFGRTVDEFGHFQPIEAIVVAGEVLQVWRYADVTGDGPVVPTPS